MKTFEVGATTLSLALFLDVTNSKELLDLMQAGTLEPEVAFFNASLIPDVFPVLAAAYKTLIAKSRESLTTRTLHSELVYNYSGSKHISESLKRCGISDTTSYILAARFGASADEMIAVKGLIKGAEIGLEELETRADQAQIQKHYKIPPPELGISSVSDAITCRIAAPDALNSPSPPVIENINLNVDANLGNVSQRKKTTYCARWSCKENEHLARCWVSISEGSVVGNNRKSDQLWIRIAREYNKNRPANTPERHWEAMKTHFYTIQRSVIAFNADYITVKEVWGRDLNDADLLMEALKKWAEKHGNQTFKLLGMWEILSECPKWANQQARDYRGKKKTRISMDNIEDRIHPIGQKLAKRKAKEKVVVYEEIIETMEEYRVISEEKLKEMRFRNKKMEYDILMRDTTGMTPEQLRIHLHFCEEIKKKWGI